MSSKTFHTAPGETRTFHVGDTVETFVGKARHREVIVGFHLGAVELQPIGGGPSYSVLPSLFVKSLTPWRVPLEQLNEPKSVLG